MTISYCLESKLLVKGSFSREEFFNFKLNKIQHEIGMFSKKETQLNLNWSKEVVSKAYLFELCPGT